MSTAIAKNFQVGSDSTATNNFTIRQPATPDGTVRIANGNSGTTTDLVTVTSAGNVGVGTTSPGGTLHLVASSANFFINQYSADSLGPSAVLAKSRGTIASPSAVLTGDSLALFSGGGYNTSSIVYNKAAVQMYAAENWTTTANGSYMTFATTAIGATGRAEAMRLDSSGNLGLGVTPSAWGSDTRALQIFNRTSLSDLQSTTQLTNNGIWNGTNWVYRETAAAGNYNINGNSHVWRIAPSGTAGNTISFTQAMTLDASGNLGVGTTTPAFNNGSGIAVYNATAARIKLGDSTSGIGAQDGLELIYDDDAYVYNRENTALIFGTNNTERARITSGGNFGLGTTNPVYRMQVQANATTYSAVFQNQNAVPYGIYVQHNGASPNNAGSEFIICWDTTAIRFRVNSNGGIENYQANNVNLSDRREKTNFAPAGDYLSKICAIPVQTFNYIDQNMEEDPGLTLGVVAQDVQSVAPELVSESNLGTKEDPKMRLSIYQTDLQYALMKCIQELKAELDSVKTELALLKGTA